MDKNFEIPSQYLKGKRENYSSWDETFMLHAVVAANRSKDPSSQVGAILVGEKNRILSLGYNGAPNSWDDDNFPWLREADTVSNTKYPYVIHAETNAILNFKGDNKDLEGATVYTTLYPCQNCAKFLAQAGIKRVVYLSNKYEGTQDNVAAATCFNYCGIKVEEFPKRLQRKLTISLIPEEGVKEQNDSLEKDE